MLGVAENHVDNALEKRRPIEKRRSPPSKGYSCDRTHENFALALGPRWLPGSGKSDKDKTLMS